MTSQSPLRHDTTIRSATFLAPAILVHLYTALGCIFGFFALVAACRGKLPEAFLYLAVATWIDYTDGTLARRYRIRARLPEIDGALLDRVVDFLVVVILPLVILHSSGRTPMPTLFWEVSILAVALFRFSRTFDPWINEGFNWGLPSYWLFPVFYIHFLALPLLPASLLLAFVMVLGCLPIGHIHPALFPRLKAFNTAGLLSWWTLYILVTQGMLSNPAPWIYASLWYPLAYLVLSWSLFAANRYQARKARSQGDG